MTGVPGTHPIWNFLEPEGSASAPPWMPAAHAILEGIEPRKTYGFGELKALSDAETEDAHFLAATTFLASAIAPVFDVELFLQDETGRHVLNPDQVQAVIKEKPIVHPVTGETIPEASEVTYIAYRTRAF